MSTTPLPDGFYDILESVSGGSNPQVLNYPDYAIDYLANRSPNIDMIKKAGRSWICKTEINYRDY